MENMNFKAARVMASLAAVAFLAGYGPALAAEMKIATVKIQVIINESAAGKVAVAKLKGLMDEETRNIQEKQKELDTMEKEFNQQKLIWRPEVAEEKEFEIVRLRRDIDGMKKDSSALLRRAQAKASQGIINDVQGIIKDYADKNAITLVLENSGGLSPSGGIVAYANDENDITIDIIKIYNEQVKAGKSSGGGE